MKVINLKKYIFAYAEALLLLGVIIWIGSRFFIFVDYPKVGSLLLFSFFDDEFFDVWINIVSLLIIRIIIEYRNKIMLKNKEECQNFSTKYMTINQLMCMAVVSPIIIGLVIFWNPVILVWGLCLLGLITTNVYTIYTEFAKVFWYEFVFMLGVYLLAFANDIERYENLFVIALLTISLFEFTIKKGERDGNDGTSGSHL